MSDAILLERIVLNVFPHHILAAEMITRAARKVGLDVRRSRNVPFGVRWEDDLAYCLQGRPLGVAIDVGAHHGETARKLCERFPDVHVHSFEPIPANFRRLEQSVVGLNVTCIPTALGEEHGTSTMGLGENSLTSGFGVSGPGITVDVDTVDAYCRRCEPESIGLLKIDVEGHEPAVLRGAAHMLEAGAIEFVLCECEFVHRPSEPHGAFQAICSILLPLGFRVVSFYTGGVDGLGWRWGDVLMWLPPSASIQAVVCSPYVASSLLS